jgi:threonylcarbamoyladenosine tRNA methylthiotransferase CDKAL1
MIYKSMNKCYKYIPVLNPLYIKILRYIRIHSSKKMTRIHRKISNNSLYHIRISNGCIGNCSFCGIKKAIGAQKSNPINECVTRFKLALNEGNKNILLVAEDAGSYGIDIDSNLPELLEKLTNISDEYSITITSISPLYIVKYIDQLKEILKKQKITNINIPIQSGSERILKLMNKYSDIEKIENTVFQLKKSFQKLEIEAQMMIGFPTETEQDFENTLDIIKKLSFDMIFILKFPNVPRTDAYTIKPKINSKEINRRIKHANKFLEELGYTMIFRKRRIFIFKN